MPLAARAQTSEVAIGVIYPFSGAQRAAVGVDAQQAYRDRARHHQQCHRFRPAARQRLGPAGSRRRQGPPRFRRPSGRSAERPRRSRAPDHAGEGLRHHRHLSERGRRHGQPDLRALSDPVRLGRQFLAEPAPPRPEYYFPAAPHDELFSAAMFDFFDAHEEEGPPDRDAALFHEDTIFGTDSANAQRKIAGERGYKIVADIKYRANSPSLTGRSAAAQGRQCRRADALELHHRRHPAGQDHGVTRLRAERHSCAGRRLFGKGAL